MWKILVLGMGKSNSLIRKKGGIPRTGKGIGFGGGGVLKGFRHISLMWPCPGKSR